MLGSNSQALEGALEDAGIGLGGTDLVREGEHLEAFQEAHSLEQLANDSARAEARITDQPAPDARAFQAL